MSPTLDPISGTPQETAAYLADVARAVNTLQGEVNALRNEVSTTAGRVVGVETTQRALSEGAASA
eukprot:14738554-Alexandrium_andersonii.AAC.1